MLGALLLLSTVWGSTGCSPRGSAHWSAKGQGVEAIELSPDSADMDWGTMPITRSRLLSQTEAMIDRASVLFGGLPGLDAAFAIYIVAVLP